MTIPALRAVRATFCLAAAFAVVPGAARAEDLTLEALKQNIDLAWMMVAAGLVLLMQVGFLLLEAGMVRSKNSINVAQKNLLDTAFCAIAFALVGFMIAFAPGNGWPVGMSGDFFALGSLTQWQTGFFVFQVMFCATAATIVSGAVAERMRLVAYVWCCIAVAGLVYPVFVHWAWGSALFENEGAFLANMGFVDFAGSTVVHATGAWVALAACIVMGPRLGRFDAAGRPVRIAGHSPVLTGAGTLLLFVGWIGFNGGSTTAADLSVAPIIANTVLAAGTGGIAGYLVGWRADGVVYPEKSMSGILGGLVAVTAGCSVLDAPGAMLIGAVGGAVAVWANSFLESRLRIDDAVGAIGVHGFAGVVGTLGLALLAPLANLPLESRLEQLWVQAAGVGLNFVWAFGAGWLIFLLLGRFFAIRVTPEQEVIGLNETEHGTRIGIGHVEKALDKLVRGEAELGMRLTTVDGDESESLTVLFNELMTRLEAEEKARRHAASLVRDAEEGERLSALADATFEAIWILVDGRIVDGNRKLEELFGLPIGQLRGREALELVEPRYRETVLEAMRLPVAEPYEVEIVAGDGTRIPAQLRGREIVFRGVAARVGCLVDMRERKDAERRIRHLASHDPLTGLPNRSVFTETLEALVGKRGGGSHGAVLLVDLDRFKDINDVHGHPAGDIVIKAAAQRLRALAGPGDTVARLGGDEFAMVTPRLDFANQAGDLAFRIVSELGLPIDIGEGVFVRSGASVGVAVAPRDGDTPERLVSRADTALYHAKNSGRNTFCMFEPQMEILNEKRRLLEADLTDALNRGEFELHYQPRVDVDTGAAVSYEALIRWRHGTRGLVSPADFIPVAEQTGKIIPIGEWVLGAACEAARHHLGGVKVSVNVSPMQLRHKGFVDMVEGVLAATGLAPEKLELEITEGVLIDDDKRAYRILNELKALGVTIALDDFGTGYSSLGYLSRFPFDTIKIDRSFVRELTTSENARAIVRTIIGLGRGLKMNVVAEGVEKMGEARLLADCGCRELQGFLLGRPAPVDALAVLDSGVLDRIAAQELPATDEMVAELDRTAEAMRAEPAEARLAG